MKLLNNFEGIKLANIINMEKRGVNILRIIKNSIIFMFVVNILLMANGTDRGGGDAVLLEDGSKAVLYDLYIQNPKFEDDYENSDRIEISKFAETMGYDRIKDVSKLKAYQIAKAALDKWKTNSPIVVNFINDALENMPFVYTQFKQNSPNKKLNPNIKIQNVVVYHKNFGARISAPVFNSLGLQSQAALLIHEALRHVQITYNQDVDTDSIIQLTKQIITGEPNGGEKLELNSLPDFVKSYDFANDLLNEVLKDLNELAMKLTDLKPNNMEKLSSYRSLLKNSDSPENEKLLELQSFLSDELANDVSVVVNWDLFCSVLETSTKVSHVVINKSLGNIASRTHFYEDAGTQIEGVWLIVTEDVLREYINGNKKVIPWNKRKQLDKMIKKIQEENKKLLEQGVLLD